MNTKTIYLIRHGQTDYNKRGVVQGSGIDSSLNELGKSQADAFFQAYKDEAFHKVYTSALVRTHQSVEGFLNKGLPHQILKGLNEISWGHKEGRVPNATDDAFYNDLTNSWKNGETHIRVEGGESPEEVASRQKDAFKEILSKQDEKHILVAMHGRALRILLTHLLGYPLSEMDRFGHENLCLYILNYDYSTEQFSLIRENDIEHLAFVEV